MLKSAPGLVLAVVMLLPPAIAWGDGQLEAQIAKAKAFHKLGTKYLKDSRNPKLDEAAQLVLARKALKTLEQAQMILVTIAEASEENENRVEKDLQDVCSMVYWCRKMTPVKADPPKTPPVTLRKHQGKSQDELAKELYDQALSYEKQHPDDTFKLAVRFYEVADRFIGTRTSLEAQRKSLQYQQKLMADLQRARGAEQAKPQPTKTAPPRAVTVGKTGEELADNLESTDAALRLAALKKIATIKIAERRRTFAALVALLGVEKDAKVAAQLQQTIGKMADTVLLRAIEQQAMKSSGPVLTACFAALGQYKKSQPAAGKIFLVLQEKLASEPSLGFQNNPTEKSHVEGNAGTIQGAYGKAPRSEALAALRMIEALHARKALIGYVKQGGKHRSEAILCLGMLGDPKAGGVIVPFISNRFTAFRGAASGALWLLGVRCSPYLISSLRDPNCRVSAAYLLSWISGQQVTRNERFWWGWWNSTGKYQK